jgi:hypothetical protein
MTDSVTLEDRLRRANPAEHVPVDRLSLYATATRMTFDFPVQAQHTRSGLRVGALTAAFLLAGGTAAVATGTVPQSVVEAFQRIAGTSEHSELTLDEPATLAATGGSPDGARYELWVGTARGGASCSYLREIRADGYDDGPTQCAADQGTNGGQNAPGRPPRLEYELVSGAAPRVLTGHLDRATVAAVVATSGEVPVGRADVTDDGWVLLVRPFPFSSPSTTAGGRSSAPR